MIIRTGCPKERYGGGVFPNGHSWGPGLSWGTTRPTEDLQEAERTDKPGSLVATRGSHLPTPWGTITECRLRFILHTGTARLWCPAGGSNTSPTVAGKVFF